MGLLFQVFFLMKRSVQNKKIPLHIWNSIKYFILSSSVSLKSSTQILTCCIPSNVQKLLIRELCIFDVPSAKRRYSKSCCNSDYSVGPSWWAWNLSLAGRVQAKRQKLFVLRALPSWSMTPVGSSICFCVEWRRENGIIHSKYFSTTGQVVWRDFFFLLFWRKSG